MGRMDTIRYPARFFKDDDGDVGVVFAEMGGERIATHGREWAHAREMAREALTLMVEDRFEEGRPLPEPAPVPEGDGWEWVYPDPQVVLAYQIRRLRELKGLTQQQAAERMGIDYATYKRWEHPRKCNATIKTLDRIARVFGRRLDVAFR